MNLKKILTPETIFPALQNATKPGVIEEMIDRLTAAGKLPDRDAALKAVRDREAKMSTGMQYGIAIPHGKTDAVDSLVAAVAIHPAGVDFEALDGQPCRIFIMTISPASRTGPHIQFLAEISRILNDASLREQILSATTADQICRLLTG